jgi:hypothetical protein
MRQGGGVGEKVERGKGVKVGVEETVGVGE